MAADVVIPVRADTGEEGESTFDDRVSVFNARF